MVSELLLKAETSSGWSCRRPRRLRAERELVSLRPDVRGIRDGGEPRQAVS